MKKILLFISIILILTSLTIVQATDNNTINTNISSQNIVDEKTFDAIETAINKTDVILLEGSYTSTGKAITINKSITLKGTNNGASLNGKGLSQILNIQADNVILENIVFYKGSSDEGGAIYNTGNNLKVINCNFTQNTVNFYGGAILTKGNNTIINNCVFTKNTAKYTGGAIQLNGNNSHVTNCMFNDNTGGHVGGAVAWVGLNGTLTDSIFKNSGSNIKTASQFGGAVVWMGDNGQIKRSSFYNNKAKNYGAAVYWKGENGSLNYCIFEDNNSTNDKAYWGNSTFVNYNYWGINIKSNEEFIENKLVFYNGTYNSPSNWINIEKTLYNISFHLNNDNMLNDYLPDYEIKDLNITISKNMFKYKKATILTIFNLETYSLYNGKYLKILFKDEKNQKISSKQIQITLNGKKYNIKTDELGIAKLQVTLKNPGNYKVVVSFKGDSNYKSCSGDGKILVKKQSPSITIKTKKKKVKIILKNQFKNVIGKTNVKIIINKKTYTMKTNKKGIIAFKLNLKNKKKYKITAKFKGNKYYNSIIKKVYIKL